MVDQHLVHCSVILFVNYVSVIFSNWKFLNRKKKVLKKNFETKTKRVLAFQVYSTNFQIRAKKLETQNLTKNLP
jgi:hypothetical protein